MCIRDSFALVALVAVGLLGVRLRKQAAPRRADKASMPAGSPPKGRAGAENRAPESTLRWLWLHTAILCALWTMHFAFFQPGCSESWTLPIVLAIIIAATLWSALPAVI